MRPSGIRAPRLPVFSTEQGLTAIAGILSQMVGESSCIAGLLESCLQQAEMWPQSEDLRYNQLCPSFPRGTI